VILRRYDETALAYGGVGKVPKNVDSRT
jgi:hypothetical protein